jgi:uncharacterized protein
MKIEASLQRACNTALDNLMEQVKGIKAVVISTEDGFEVAARVENTAQIARLSAMASSLAALGAMAGEESQLGICHGVVIDAAEGHIAILQVRRSELSLIVSVVTGRDAVVGQVLYYSRQAAAVLQAA